MRKGAILAGLVTGVVLVQSPAQSAEDRNRPTCDFHVFTDMNDRWALSEGAPRRKWLVMNVGDGPVIVKGSEITTPQHPEHEELIATGESTIATMKYGQPVIHLASAGDAAMSAGNNTSGGNVSDTSVTAVASSAEPAISTTGADMGTDGASTTGMKASGGTDTMAASDKATPAAKTTVVICRFFERRR